MTGEVASGAAQGKAAQEDVAREQVVLLTLLSRGYCHLCHDMEAALAALLDELKIEVEVVDVDADEALLARYDELVPVLLHGEQEICHYHLDVDGLRRHLAQLRR